MPDDSGELIFDEGRGGFGFRRLALRPLTRDDIAAYKLDRLLGINRVPVAVERVVNGIVRRLESSGESDVPTKVIGEMVMDALNSLDQVAYVRFASVYRDFREARDFNAIIDELESGAEFGGDRDD